VEADSAGITTCDRPGPAAADPAAKPVPFFPSKATRGFRILSLDDTFGSFARRKGMDFGN